jgi:hypothetical protein
MIPSPQRTATYKSSILEQTTGRGPARFRGIDIAHHGGFSVCPGRVLVRPRNHDGGGLVGDTFVSARHDELVDTKDDRYAGHESRIEQRSVAASKIKPASLMPRDPPSRAGNHQDREWLPQRKRSLLDSVLGRKRHIGVASVM